jgi:hypothetical protein
MEMLLTNTRTEIRRLESMVEEWGQVSINNTTAGDQRRGRIACAQVEMKGVFESNSDRTQFETQSNLAET